MTTTDEDPGRAEVEASDTRRAVAAAAIGNATEWYDFGIFSYLVTVLGKVFYPESGIAMIATFATFSVAFLARPLGGMFFGPLGDRIGRQKVLAITMLLMAGATTAIGVLPSYAAIGIWAPVLLVLLRLVQGFSTGGEYAGAATFIAEYAPDRRRGFLGSFLELGTLAGYVVGAALATGLTVGLGEDSPEMLSWGWRIPFLIAGPLGAVGLYLRYRLEDTPAFREISSQSKEERGETPGVKEAFTRYLRPMLFCMAVLLVFNVSDYTLLTYLPDFLGGELGLGTTTGLLIVVGVMIVLMFLVNPVGLLSDRVGRRPLLLAACGSFVVLSIPAFLLMRQGSLVMVSLGVLVMGLALVLVLGTMPSTLPALFSTRHRYGTFAIAYNLGTAVFGGTTPVLMAALVPVIGTLAPAYWLMVGGAVSLVAVYFMQETAGRPLED
jgi:MHS family proline/betaine transporter-like MFS transporter